MNNSAIIRLSLLLFVAAILGGLSRVECAPNNLEANTMENYLILSRGQAVLGHELMKESRPRYAKLLKAQVDFVNKKRLDMGTKVGLGSAMKEAFAPDDGPAEGVNLGYQHNILHPGTSLSVDPTAFKQKSLLDSLAAGALAKAQAGEVKAVQKNL